MFNRLADPSEGAWRFSTFALTFLLTAAFPSRVAGETVELLVSDDAWINANQSGTNFGQEDDVFVHNFGPKHGLFRFSTTSIEGQTILSARMEFFIREMNVNQGVQRLRFHPITENWNESFVTWANQPAIEPPAFPDGSQNSFSSAGLKSVDLTGLVQRWAAGELPNLGLMVISGGPARAFIDAKERPSGFRARLIVETEGPVVDTGILRVLDLTQPDACVIDQPGHYVLDRSWGSSGDAFTEVECQAIITPTDEVLILVSAADVTLDFRGFQIKGDPFADGDILRVTAPGTVTLANGVLFGGDVFDDMGRALSSGPDSRIVIENMRRISGARLGPESIIRNSNIDGGLTVGEQSTVVNSRVSWSLLAGAGSRILNNQIFRTAPFGNPAALTVEGENSIVTGNTISCSNCERGVWVRGAGNRVANNTLAAFDAQSFSMSPAIQVDGEANQVDGNAVMPNSFQTGIRFNGGGNFYGDNRVSATVPFELGPGQTDWGGNVSY